MVMIVKPWMKICSTEKPWLYYGYDGKIVFFFTKDMKKGSQKLLATADPTPMLLWTQTKYYIQIL